MGGEEWAEGEGAPVAPQKAPAPEVCTSPTESGVPPGKRERTVRSFRSVDSLLALPRL